MDDDIFLQGPIEFDGPEPIQQQLTWEEYRVNRMPVVGDDVDDFVISGIDLTFGLGDTFPGLRKLMTISGPIEFWRGFVFGSAVSNHTSLDQCYDNTDSLLIANLEMVNNRTGNIFRAPDFGEMVFSTFDLFKVFADIFGGLYPVTFSCWGAGEWIVGHYWSTLKLNTTIKPYLMNIVYNFGDVFDALGGFWFFMKAETRGQEDEVFDAGDSLGQAFFYLINPEMPDYASQADLEGLRE